VDHRYVAAVERAGGCPVLLPMTARAEALEPLLAQLAGLVITGGPGIVRGVVGDLPPDLPPVSPLRDAADTWAFEGMRRRGRPVLGICYGMQFINACCGGTLYADVQAQRGTGPHSPGRNHHQEVRHGLRLVAGTRLAALVGAAATSVNSFHLQAVEELGDGLQVSATSPEGLIEGLESEDGRLVGVQFHPERMPGTVWDRLFAQLVRAAG
jgi:putative glutamine amidotransferase